MAANVVWHTATRVRADITRTAEPRAAAHHAPMTAVTAWWCVPAFPVGGCALVGSMPAVLCPFPDIAMHVIEPEFVGLVLPNLEGLCKVVALWAVVIAPTTIEIRLIGRNGLAGCKHRL